MFKKTEQFENKDSDHLLEKLCKKDSYRFELLEHKHQLFFITIVCILYEKKKEKIL